MRQHSELPTLPRLGLSDFTDESVDAKQIATEWFSAFSTALEKANVPQTLDLLVENALWRDLLALTWDLRTFQDASRIKVFLTDRIGASRVNSFSLKRETIALLRPFPDLAWIQASFSFETEHGICSGIFRLVPGVDGKWKAHGIFTLLEELKGFPEQVGLLRNQEPNHGKWAAQRRAEQEFENSEPTVVIVGGGQAGLELAARLKVLGVSNLIVEKNARLGDNWRNRYSALCLHDPVWNDHMPYLPFPSTWPVYTPALKFANWLESYAENLELNSWTSAAVTSVRKDSVTGEWAVKVSRGSQERTLHPKHVVFATGLNGKPNMPKFPGMDEFEGQILHSTQHGKAQDHTGKKVVVVGACTSAHDICMDYVENGVDVTMYQRSSTYVISVKNSTKYVLGAFCEGGLPVDDADRFVHSFPHLLNVEMIDRITHFCADQDKGLLDGLQKRGFRTNLRGLGPATWHRAGGYYLDVGASQQIIDGKIKLKNDAELAAFTPSGLKFADGSETHADAVIFASGSQNPADYVRELLGDELGPKISNVWGLDEEGEIVGAYKHCGIDNLWYMCGHIGLCRFYSRRVALQIKAIEEGVFGPRYSQ